MILKKAFQNLRKEEVVAYLEELSINFAGVTEESKQILQAV
jgi:hypothetical protein